MDVSGGRLFNGRQSMIGGCVMRVDGAGSGSVTQDVADEQRAAEAPASANAAEPVEAAASAPAPGQTLAEMARSGPQLSDMTARQASVPAGPAGETSFGDQVRGTTQRPIDLQMAQMANDVYSHPVDGHTNTQSEGELNAAGWHRVQPGETLRTPDGRSIQLDPAQLNDPSSGFQAAVYQHKDGQVVVAFAGTDMKSVRDWGTDAGQGLGLQTRQYELAARLGVKMVGVFGAENVAFTGHSLGGGLAATATLASGAQGVTFNAAGLSNETLREYGSPNTLRAEYASNGTLRSYSVAGDPLTAVGHSGIPHPIGTELQMPNVSGSRNPITVHGGGGNDQLYVEGLRPGQPPAIPTPAASLRERLTEQSRQAAVNTLGTAVDTAWGFGKDVVRVGGETARDVAGAVRNPDVFTPSRVVAELADGGLQVAGASADRALDGLGRQATVLTDAAGQGARELLRGTPWEGRLDSLATRLESSGEVVRGALDQAGDNVRHVADRTGDLVATLPDRAKDAAVTAVQGGAAVATTALAGARDVGRAAAEGGRAVAAAGADAVVDTARSALTGLGRVASTAGQAARDTVSAVRAGDFGQAARTVAEAPVKVAATAVRETVRHLGSMVSEARSVLSTASDKAVEVARSVADSGRAVASTALDKAGELASKLNPFKWSF
jgi:hypothetical protein